MTAVAPALVAAAALVLLAAGVHELFVLAVSGAAALVASGRRQSFGAFAASALATVAPASAASFSLGLMFLLFLKTGAVLFGSGYVLLAFLRADFVERLGWLTEQQLLDAIAVGQLTPGPVSTTATFIGYLLGGPLGALVATVGIFLPAFVFVALTRPLVDRVRRSARMAALLDGINAGSLAMMVFVLAQLARSAVVDGLTLAIAIVSSAGHRAIPGQQRLVDGWEGRQSVDLHGSSLDAWLAGFEPEGCVTEIHRMATATCLPATEAVARARRTARRTRHVARFRHVARST